MNPKFTIITPVYNRSDCVKKCIDSVLSQSFVNWEHIIIDDGSTDNTPSEVINSIGTDSRFRFIRLEKNSGTNAARNKGLDNVNGDFILFLDSDDILKETSLEKINNIIECHSEYNYFLFGVSDREDYYNKLLYPALQEKEIKYRDWLNNEVDGDFCHVIKREILVNVRFHTKYRIYEHLTFIELYKLSARQLFTNIIISEIDRTRGDSVTFEANLYKPNSIRFKKEVFKIKLEKYRGDYISLNCCEAYYNLLCNLYVLCLLDNDYKYIKVITNYFKEIGKTIPFSYKAVYNLRLGLLFNGLVRCYSYIKHIIKSL